MFALEGKCDIFKISNEDLVNGFLPQLGDTFAIKQPFYLQKVEAPKVIYVSTLNTQKKKNVQV